MKSLNKDLLLITLCAAVILASSYLLHRELTLRINRSDKDAIGTIIFKKKTAERKYAEYVIWEDIPNNAPVFNYDSVRTFTDSAAFIRLKSGAEISLDEDTMIVIVADEKGVKINFDRGSVSAKSASSSSENISLNTKDLSISMDKGELSIKKASDTVDVNVSSGEILLNTGGEVKKIDTNMSAHVVEGKTELKKISVVPEYPSGNSCFVTYKNSDRINFRWKSDSSAEETMQISADPEFKDIKVAAVTSQKSHTAEITPGDYYWRVISSGEPSVSKKFTLMRDVNPEMIYPANGEILKLSGDDEAVNFRWNKSDLASGYQLELTGGQNPATPVKTLRTGINSASVPGLQPGKAKWTLTRLYPENFIKLADTTISGSIDIERVVVTRIKPRPLHDREMIASALSDNIIFNWEGGKGVKNYIVDIASDREFRNIIRSSATDLTFHNNGKLPAGKYFWRISAVYDTGDPVLSETVFLSVSMPEPPVYLSPQNGAVIDIQNDLISFAWKDPSDSGSYIFETSADPGFTANIQSLITGNTTLQISKPGEGKFYWRVSIADKSGARAVQGKTAFYTIPETLQKPAIINPPNMNMINLDNTDSISFRWGKIAGADSYELELFQRVSGTDRSILIMNTDKTEITLKNFALFDPGTIVWVVRARKSDKGKITAMSESDRNYFILKVSENISAPKTQNPEIIYVR